MSDVPVIVRIDEDGEPISITDAMAEVIEDVRAQGMAMRAASRPVIEVEAVPVRGRTGRKGRPTRCNAKLIETICQRIVEGEYQESAALAVGISRATFFQWKAKGEEARTRLAAGGSVPNNQLIYVDFLDAVEEARAKAEARVIAALQRSALGGEVSKLTEWTDDQGNLHREVTFTRPNVAAQTWWLERSFPDRYGRRIEVSGPEGGAIPVEVEVSARDLLKQKLGQASRRLGQGETSDTE